MFNFALPSGAARQSRLRAQATGIRGRWQRYLWISLAGATAAAGQGKVTNTADGALAAVLAMGVLTPANTSAVASTSVQFRLRNQNNPNGYRLDATATFTPGAAATVNGGDTIAATDVGVGITSITTSANVLLPRADVILAGFNYDPSTVTAADGLTPYTNAAGGRATLADLATGKKILSGNRIATTVGTGSPNYLTVTMKFGILPQYFSPSSFSSVITLTISNGP
jgi:hypothetical protein